MSTFNANYPGTCTRCEGEFEPGDEVGYVEDELACGDCYDEIAASITMPPPVPPPWERSTAGDPREGGPFGTSTMDEAVSDINNSAWRDRRPDPVIVDVPLPPITGQVMGPVDDTPVPQHKCPPIDTRTTEEQAWVRELMVGYETRSAGRSSQLAIGPSELGGECDRRIAFKISGTPRVNWKHTPGWPALVGTALHGQFEAMLRWANETEPGRYLIEHTVDIIDGEIVGHLDVYDRLTRRLKDWKFPGSWSVKNMRANGVGDQYRVQGHVYAYGLARAGEHPKDIAIIAIDKTARSVEEGIHVEVYDYDPGAARAALTRYEEVKSWMDGDNGGPMSMAPTPSKLCDYCNFYAPGVAGYCAGTED